MKLLLRTGIAGALAAGLALSMLSAHADEATLKKHGPITWTDSLAKAEKACARDKKPVMVDFWAEWCGPCKAMLATTYKDKAVVARSKQFEPVLINVDEQKAVADKYQVNAIPTVLFLDQKGNVLLRSMGYASSADFLKLMSEASKKLK